MKRGRRLILAGVLLFSLGYALLTSQEKPISENPQEVDTPITAP